WMLFSHKVCRWAVPWASPLGLVGLAVLAPQSILALAAMALALLGMGLGSVGILLSNRIDIPRLLAVPAFALASNVAALHAGTRAMQGKASALWEPTRREVITSSPRRLAQGQRRKPTRRKIGWALVYARCRNGACS